MSFDVNIVKYNQKMVPKLNKFTDIVTDLSSFFII